MSAYIITVEKPQYNIDNAQEILLKCSRLLTTHLTPERMLHSMGVVITGLELMGSSRKDDVRICLAALLHDIGRPMLPDELRTKIHQYGGQIPEEDESFPQLWHGIYASLILQHELAIKDAELSNAILWHSTAEADMTMLQKIIFLADYIEPTRDFPGIDTLRLLAYNNLDKALSQAIEMKYTYLLNTGIKVHQRLIRAYQWYVKKRTHNEK